MARALVGRKAFDDWGSIKKPILTVKRRMRFRVITALTAACLNWEASNQQARINRT